MSAGMLFKARRWSKYWIFRNQTSLELPTKPKGFYTDRRGFCTTVDKFWTLQQTRWQPEKHASQFVNGMSRINVSKNVTLFKSYHYQSLLDKEFCTFHSMYPAAVFFKKKVKFLWLNCHVSHFCCFVNFPEDKNCLPIVAL